MVVVLLLVAVPAWLDSCAIAPPAPVFSISRRPANIQGEFLKGKLGVVRGSWQRRHLLAAWRMLSGAPLTDAESTSLYAPRPAAEPDRGPVQDWLDSHTKILGRPAGQYINSYKSENRDGQYAFYQNCLDSAFVSARKTLEERAAKWGAKDSRTLAWAAAQDKVFENCSAKKPVIPDPPTAGSDPLLAADRAYQIAAAYFYAGDWPKAREALAKIASDNASPWRGIAPYVAARTYLREGSIGGKLDALREAESRLTAIVRDPSRAEWHESASRLLDYVHLRVDPNTRMAQLAADLAQPGAAKDFGQEAADLLFLYNRNVDSDAVVDATAVTRWLRTLEQSKPEDHAYAAEQWKKTHNAAWLVAALQVADPESAAELVRDAHAVKPGTPAYETAVWAGIEAGIRAGHKDEARKWADEALAGNLLLSTRNQILTDRLALARDFSEFLRFAPRRPEPRLQDDDGREEEADKPPIPSGDGPLFDEDSTGGFNHSLPLALWIQASQSPLLPPYLETQIAQAAWVRAVVLGKDVEAAALFPRTGASAGSLPLMVLLQSPDLLPNLLPGNVAPVDLSKPDRSGAGHWGFGKECSDTDPDQGAVPRSYLTAAQLADADREIKQLAARAPSGANWLAKQTIEWANAHLDDQRAPEMLHLAVQATRRGCRDDQTGTYSKQAFDLLHRRYPNSPWTAQTKYWYK
jgi:hypothetical protein